MNRSIPLLLLLFVGISIHAQNTNTAKLDSLFERIDVHKKGMNSVSIYKNGVEIYQNSIGYEDAEEKIPSSEKTKYRIGSISKTFTAAVIMKLVESGKLSLDTKLATFYPKVKNAKMITVEQMLRHSSGIFNFTNNEDYLAWSLEPRSREQIVKKIKSYKPAFKPGEKAEYSNSNYIFLSLIAEKLHGKDFAEIVQEEICIPCTLSNTYYGDKIDVENNEANSYLKINTWVKWTETDMSIPMGAGAIVSNPSDLNKFFDCLFSVNLVSRESLVEMTSIKDRYGIGLFSIPFIEKEGIGHNGGIDQFSSMAVYFPNENTAISITSNGSVMPVNDIFSGILNIYFNEPYELPIFKKVISLNTEDLDQYLGLYSSPGFPLKLDVTKQGSTLFAQGTGQSAFVLSPVGDNIFVFEGAQIEIIFSPQDNTLLLKQRGQETEFKR